MSAFDLFGFTGTTIVALAYIPQISHLVTQHCAYGLSVKAWLLWLVAALLILPYAISSGDKLFLSLQGVHVIAIAFIFFFSCFHQGKVCVRHKIL